MERTCFDLAGDPLKFLKDQTDTCPTCSHCVKHPAALRHSAEAALWPDLHDERCACGDIGLLGLQLAVGIVEAVPGGADHVDHVSVDHREIGEAPRGDAQHAEVVVQRRRAVFDLDALLFVIHRAVLSEQRSFLKWQCVVWSQSKRTK